MDILLAVLLGVPYTVGVVVFALVIGAILAVPLAAARASNRSIVRVPARLIIDILRGIPPIVWLFVIFFGVGNELIPMEPFEAGCVGLGLISAAYLAEIYRGGLSAVHKGQWEASAALGLGSPTALALVVAPQAFRVALPSATTYAIGLLKDSSVISAIGITDIVFQATAVQRSTGSGLTAFLVAAAIYIVLGTPLAFLSRRLDTRLRQKVAR